MTDLLSQLQTATEGSRELDCAIHAVKIGKPVNMDELGGHVAHVPRYSTNLQDAVSLVPEGWSVSNIGQNDDKTWWAELREGFITSYDRVASSGLRCPTPALALCIAIIKAHESKAEAA